MARVFAVMVQIGAGVRNRGTNSRVLRFEAVKINLVEATWCSIAVQPGTKPLLSHGADVSGWHMRVSGFKATIIFLRGRIKRKNRDKQMIFIVRVRLSNLYLGVREEFGSWLKIKLLKHQEGIKLSLCQSHCKKGANTETVKI